MTEQPAFGELLRRFRLAAGLSQEALAERSRVSARAISDLERGARRQPYRETVRQLATALDLPSGDQAALLRAGRGTRRPRGTSVRTVQPAPEAPLLLATKLVPPLPRRVLVERQRLTDRIQAGVQGPLTLLSAPPGSGKTTVLGAWYRVISGSDWAVAWVSLDGGDNDPVRFWSHVLAALDRAGTRTITAPFIRLQPAAHLQSPYSLANEDMLTALVNWWSEASTPHILVLDDYHEIVADEIHQGLTFLLAHRPPCLHLLIASRTDPPLPLAQLRARDGVVEIRAADLRFTPEEARDFLTTIMGLRLSAAEVLALHERTEGWIAGLQLAALSLRARDGTQEIGSFIDAFTGSHRYVLDYLVDEVLRQQPKPVQRFLLRTSILKRVNAPLCAAVLAGDPELADTTSMCQGILERLERDNLFVVALDDTRQWYRYHQLFADALRQRLLEEVDATQVGMLHHQAATWLEAHGLQVEAISHMLEARAFDRAAALLEQVALKLLLHGEVQTLQGWLAALPEAEWQAWPRLCLVQAWLVADLHTFDAVGTYVQLAEKALQAAPSRDTPDIRGELAVTKIVLVMLNGRPAEAIVLAQEALALLSTENLLMRYVACTCLAAAYAGEDRLDLAIQTLGQGIEDAHATGHMPLALMMVEDQSYFLRARSKLTQAVAVCRAALGWANGETDAELVFACGVLRSLADLLCEWNDLDEAAHYIAKAMALRGALGQISTKALNLLVLARIRIAQGDHEAALAALHDARVLTQPHAGKELIGALLALFEGCEAQAHLARSDMRAAAKLLEHPAPVIEPSLVKMSSQILIYFFDHGPVARIQVRIAQGRAAGKAEPLYDALDLLEQERLSLLDVDLPWRRIKTGVLRALALDALGQEEQALAALVEAIKVAAPERYVRSFAQEGAPLARLLQRVQAAAHAGEPAARGVPTAYVDTLLVLLR
jgi:LuxR family maltose regulon positive regulatory protein